MNPDSRRRERALFLSACALELVVLAILAEQRSVNADEGFYLLAGLRVLEGKSIYRDFFFPQMPYLPFAEAMMMSVAGPSLLAMRWIGVLTGAAVAGVLAVVSARQTQSLFAGALVAVAYASHSLVLNYLSIIKTYGISNLGLVLAFACLALPRKPRRLASLIAGVASGMAIGTRLPAMAAAAVFFLWVCVMGRRQVVAFVAGGVLASFPWLIALLESPDHFWFCNFGFHRIRGEIDGLLPMLAQKAEVSAKWVFLPQNLLLWLGAAVGARVSPRQVGPALACVGALSCAYLAATPTYLDYMVQIVPFLLLALAPAAAVAAKRPLVLALLVGLWVGGGLWARRAAPEDSVRGAKARLWNASIVAQVADYLEKNSNPEDRILSWWEGYPALANREGYVGVGFWESNIARKLSEEERRRYHILHLEDLQRLILAADPRFVVLVEGVWEDLGPALAQHYERAKEIGPIRILSRRGSVGEGGA